VAGQTPAVGTLAATVDLQQEAMPFESGYAIELGGARPDWFTPQLEQQVLAAQGQPVAAPQDAPFPGEVGLRPGS
jgi:hypothetical protein